MALFYASVGADHFLRPEWYVKIMPPSFPFKYGAVYVSGFFEILFGALLVPPLTRFFAGWGLIILLIAVYPANIYLAMTNGEALNISPIFAWIRLPIQFIFIGIAYWHTKKI
tara:strand:- start:21957 stop:22292 length:336 start_codon:yes stop_codon:yes gene_type:complete